MGEAKARGERKGGKGAYRAGRVEQVDARGRMTIRIFGAQDLLVIDQAVAPGQGDEEPPNDREHSPEAGRGYRQGDELLLRLHPGEPRIIRKIDGAKASFIARFEDDREGGTLTTIAPGREHVYPIAGKTHGAQSGDIVLAAISREFGRVKRVAKSAKIIRRIGNIKDAHIFSEIAIAEHGITREFSDQAMEEAEAARARLPGMLAQAGIKAGAKGGSREDLTHLPFITIDPADARDHDDAIHVEAHEDGYRLYVAIADVAGFVQAGGALDQEARARGNSVYFPDRAVPMLPSLLSGDVCSLHEGEPRPVICVALDIGPDGGKRDHRFTRAIINSRASLSYEEAQAIIDGGEDAKGQAGADICETVLRAHSCYLLLQKASARRGVLDLDLPEAHIDLSPDGQIASLSRRERLDAHRLIEEAMILANVAASESAEEAGIGILYRVHEAPSAQKSESLGRIGKLYGQKLARSTNVTTAMLNAILARAGKQGLREAASLQLLRAQRQARYSPANNGHFGLALERYSHFTSPIRRYSDLVTQRALILALGLGQDGDALDQAALEALGEHSSSMERLAAQAERDTASRYAARFLEEHIGEEYEGTINGVTRAGLFVTLDGFLVDGYVGMHGLGDDHYRFERREEVLRGKAGGRIFRIGHKVKVRIIRAEGLSGALEFMLLEHQSKAIPMRNTRRPAKLARKGRGQGRGSGRARRGSMGSKSRSQRGK